MVTYFCCLCFSILIVYGRFFDVENVMNRVPFVKIRAEQISKISGYSFNSLSRLFQIYILHVKLIFMVSLKLISLS